MSHVQCSYSRRCGGCPQLDIPYDEQVDAKVRAIIEKVDFLYHGLNSASVWPRDIEVRRFEGGGYRDRVDLTLISDESGNRKIGLYERKRNDGEQPELLNIEYCPALSPALAEWFEHFRRDLPSIKKGSLRLRVAPNGRRGVWLDIANVDVKRLLEEESWLRRLKSKAVVEIGQKYKRLVERDGKLKLGEPELYPWFETYGERSTFPIFTVIGGFTQPSFRGNQLLVREVMGQIKTVPAKRVIELCAGSGNFTLPVLDLGFEVFTYENELESIAGLKRSAQEARLDKKLTSIVCDIYRSFGEHRMSVEGCDLILVDPPRSGLGPLLKVFEEMKKRPSHFIYVSCYEESFFSDAAQLLKMNYQLRKVTLVDQFPNTKHSEIVGTFELMA